jgi:hypothetical protein
MSAALLSLPALRRVSVQPTAFATYTPAVPPGNFVHLLTAAVGPSLLCHARRVMSAIGGIFRRYWRPVLRRKGPSAVGLTSDQFHSDLVQCQALIDSISFLIVGLS